MIKVDPIYIIAVTDQKDVPFALVDGGVVREYSGVVVVDLDDIDDGTCPVCDARDLEEAKGGGICPYCGFDFEEGERESALDMARLNFLELRPVGEPPVTKYFIAPCKYLEGKNKRRFERCHEQEAELFVLFAEYSNGFSYPMFGFSEKPEYQES